MNFPLNQVCDIRVCAILDDIAQFAVHQLPKVEADAVQHKKDAADLVSNRDYIMESKIIEIIHRVFPDHTVISEEIGIVGEEQAEHQWLVDPIDGSCNDAHGIPWSSVSVAYVRAGEMVAGTVIDTHVGEVFQAVHGHGATLNGRPIQISHPQGLPGSVVMTELLNQHAWRGMYPFIDFLAGEDATVRIMGSTALSIVQVAAGRAAAAVFGDSGAVDVTAAILIALEAGAVVLKDGQPLSELPNGQLIVAAPSVVSKVKQAVMK